MFDTVLFDLDGTLTDPFEGISNSVAYALQKFGISVADKRGLKKFIGPPLYESFMVYYGFNKADALKSVEYYREYYAEKGIFECFLYGGIEFTLRELAKSGKRLAVATSKPEIFANKILRHFGLLEFFPSVAGATLDSSRVAKADVIKYALGKFSIRADGAVMVGDRMHDILGAKENGLHAAGVLYGYGSREELVSAGADFVAETPNDILKFV